MTAATNTNLLDEFRSQSLNPSLLHPLIHRLLSHPKIFNGFIDILKLPTVQDTLSKIPDESKRSALIKTVELFAYGTISEYYALKNQGGDGDGALVWSLNDAQLEKLRMLSVVSIAREQVDKFHASTSSSSGDVEMADDSVKTKSKGGKRNKKKKSNATSSMLSIPYSRLASELHVLPEEGDGSTTYNDEKHMRQLEDLLIQCIYSNLISAKLDQSSKSLKIEPHLSVTQHENSNEAGSNSVYGSIFTRDLRTNTEESTKVEVTRMISTLQTFLKQSNALLRTLEQSTTVIMSDRTEDEVRWKMVSKAIEDGSTRVSGREGGGGGAGSGAVGPMMMGMGLGGGDSMMEGSVDMRRQVKRSKGGHSMMMGGSGGGNVRFG